MFRRFAIRSTFAVAVTLLLSATAQAQAFRAYLAPTGNDANPCSLAAPCRLLPAALAAVVSGAEIWMLGSAISIAAAGLKVALRNLVIVPLPASGATDGIAMTGASALTIEDSLIANLPGYGVFVIGTGTV